MANTKQGFTLIELSIVLVIISLIAGGVLVGRSLVSAAEIRAQVTQMERIAAAINTFRTKYNALPGDITNPAAYGIVPPPGYYVGNGNGVIDDYNGAVPIVQFAFEPLTFFGDLAQVNLIPSNYVTGTSISGNPCQALTYADFKVAPGFLSMALNPQMGMSVTSFNGSVNLILAIADCSAPHYGYSGHDGVMTPAQAYGIDKKIDDGFPITGTVFAMGPPTSWRPDTGLGVPDTLQAEPTPDQCVTTAGAAYNLAVGTIQCRLLVKMQ